MTPRARVLVVDDSVVARRIIAEVLNGEPRIEVVGTAPSGPIALAKIPILEPDIVTLDVDMPEMNGLEVLATIRARHPSIRVIMVSSLTERGASATVDSLILGASDYVAKTSGAASAAEARLHLESQLVPKVLALGPRLPSQPAGAPRPPSAAPPRRARRHPHAPEVVAMGASTGGPNALLEVLSAIPDNFPAPILIVQHMPEGFTSHLARRLDSKCRLTVVEAQDGMRPVPGLAIVARGNYHLEVSGKTEGPSVRINQEPPVHSCRPSVDVLFRSVASCYGGASLCVVLTGMGYDGLQGCREVQAAGGQVIAQDQTTSVVWGMPGAVAGAGLAEAVLPVGEIGMEVVQRVRGPRP